MIKKKVRIKKKEWLGHNIFGLEFFLPGIAPLPGQFLQIRINENFDPFLNRPISIASYRNGKLRLIIKLVGRGTALLSEKRVGDQLTLFGPLGNGVDLTKAGPSVLVAGGIGIAPLFFLGEQLKKKRKDFTFIYGVKRHAEFILRAEIRHLTKHTIFVAEKTGQRRMTAIQALNRLRLDSYEQIYACGPRAMLIQMQAMNLPIPIYAFCEDFLGCGCGLCLGCAIKYRNEYKRVCSDGPVFILKDIDFNG